MAVALRFTDAVDDAEVSTTAAAVSKMADVVEGSLAEHHGLPFPDLTVIVTADVEAVIDEQVADLHLPAGQAGLSSAVGTVSGKTLVEGGQRPVVVVALRDPAWASYHSTLITIAHELGHVLDLTVVASTGGAVDPTTPAEWDRVTGESVACEFRAERIGMVLSGHAFTVDNSATGESLDLWAERRQGLAADLDPLLDRLVPSVPDAIESFRTSGIDNDTWRGVTELLAGVIEFLGYLEGSNSTGQSLIAASTKPGGDLLRPIWEPLFDHLESSAIYPPGEEWADDRAEIGRIAEAGIDEVYRSLGAARIPTGPGTYVVDFAAPTWRP